MCVCCVLQEWKERYGNQREDYTARNRSSHEMKETSYSDTMVPSNNRRKSPNSRFVNVAHISKMYSYLRGDIKLDC